jgi:hypothetical protein
MSERFDTAVQRLDALNADDPVKVSVKGVETSRLVAEADRVSAWILHLCPDASEALRLAARAQHLMRWKVARSDYPEGRIGYRTWRRAAMDFHATETRRVLQSVGYDEETLARVSEIVQKHGLRKNPEVQLMEDALCLSFLEHDFEPFATKHTDEKLVHILKETWQKMSPAGHAAASELLPKLPERLQRLIRDATG